MIKTCLLIRSVVATSLADPLPFWNDTEPKQAIISFVEKVTKEGSSDFVPVPERITVFDNDGTPWSEQPMYFQAFFVFDRIKPFASVLKGDLKAALAGGEHALLEMVMATHAGMTPKVLDKAVSDGLATGKHPESGLAEPPCTISRSPLGTEVLLQRAWTP